MNRLHILKHFEMVIWYTFVADSFHVYHDGIRRPESYSPRPEVPEPFEFSEIVFGRVHVNLNENYCNCAVDEVQIFETELNEDEVKSLHESTENNWSILYVFQSK